MKKRFIARGRSINKSKLLIFIIIFFCILIFYFLCKNFLNVSPKNVKRMIMVAGNNYNNNLFSNFVISGSGLNDNIKTEEKVLKNNEELIYIYNTHQTEDYAPGLLKEYNLKPTVLIASHMLSKFLKNYNIISVVEERDLKTELNKRDYTYNDTYTLTYSYLEEIHEKYPSIKYFIDVHRDSTSGSVIINDKKYAKMMFVVGKNHDNYKLNEELVLKLKDYLDENYNGVMRSIFYGKNSRYNQHFNENVFLVEIGGVENTIDEVYNSVQILAEAISYVIGV